MPKGKTKWKQFDMTKEKKTKEVKNKVNVWKLNENVVKKNATNLLKKRDELLLQNCCDKCLKTNYVFQKIDKEYKKLYLKKCKPNCPDKKV